MSYRVKRTDSNQKSIVETFRALGGHVYVTSDVGKGFPDIILGLKGNFGRWLGMIEIKDGSRPPSQRKLTEDEEKFHDEWKGFVHIITSEEEAIALVDKVMGLER